jgi:hypothetical protein
MLIAVPVLAVGIFTAIFLRRLKADVEQEKAFRAQLSGIDFDRNQVSLS